MAEARPERRRAVWLLALRTATVALALLTAAALLGRLAYFELTTHFRLQYALAATALVALLALARSWRFAGLGLVCAVLNWSYIVPYLPLGTPPAVATPPATNVRLFSSNLLFENREWAAVLRAVASAQPDVIVLQELTPTWWEWLRPLTKDYPHVQALPLADAGGIAVLSRYPILHSETLDLSGPAHPGLLATLDVEGRSLVVLAMHPQKPTRPEGFAARNEQLERAAAVLRAHTGPKVLIGDLNTTPWSPYFSDLVREAGLRDARLGHGILPTWPAPLPGLLRIPIDHCLVGETTAVDRIATLDDLGSDHCALVVDISLPRAAR